MGWTPESGFLNARWEHYCELMMIYLLAIGSPTHPLAGKFMGCVDAPEDSIPGNRIYFRQRSDFHASVFAGLVRLQEETRRLRGLFREFRKGHEGSQTLLLVASRKISRL